VVSKEIAEFMDQYRWETVSTYAGHPISMAAVCANLEVMIEENLVDQSRQAGDYIREKLTKLQEKHESLGSFDGSGVLWIVELVNPKTKKPYVELDRNFSHNTDLSQHPSQVIF